MVFESRLRGPGLQNWRIRSDTVEGCCIGAVAELELALEPISQPFQ